MRRFASAERVRKAGLGGTQPSCRAWPRSSRLAACQMMRPEARRYQWVWEAAKDRPLEATPGPPARRARVEQARDLIWLHTAPDTYRLLVLERGWALDDYERWLATSLTATLLPAPVPPTSS